MSSQQRFPLVGVGLSNLHSRLFSPSGRGQFPVYLSSDKYAETNRSDFPGLS
jgi:hypothetical protein